MSVWGRDKKNERGDFFSTNKLRSGWKVSESEKSGCGKAAQQRGWWLRIKRFKVANDLLVVPVRSLRGWTEIATWGASEVKEALGSRAPRCYTVARHSCLC